MTHTESAAAAGGVFLESGPLLVRRLASADAAVLFRWINDPMVLEYSVDK